MNPSPTTREADMDDSIGIWFADDYDEDDIGHECWQCGGEGYVYGCSWDWQCDTWDGESCLCHRPCDICHPPKPNPELQQVLAEALAEAAKKCPRCHGEGHLYRQDCGAHGLTITCTECLGSGAAKSPTTPHPSETGHG